MLKVVTDEAGVWRKVDLFRPEFQVCSERMKTLSRLLAFDVTYNFQLSST